MSKVTLMECVHSEDNNWFTVGNVYDSENKDGIDFICGDDLVSDLNGEDWYDLSKRADGLYFLVGFEQIVLFKPVSNNRYIYHYCAVNKNSTLTMSGIAKLTSRIVSQDDLDKLISAVSNNEFTATAITSLSYLGREHEQTD